MDIPQGWWSILSSSYGYPSSLTVHPQQFPWISLQSDGPSSALPMDIPPVWWSILSSSHGYSSSLTVHPQQFPWMQRIFLQSDGPSSAAPMDIPPVWWSILSSSDGQQFKDIPPVCWSIPSSSHAHATKSLMAQPHCILALLCRMIDHYQNLGTCCGHFIIENVIYPPTVNSFIISFFSFPENQNLYKIIWYNWRKFLPNWNPGMQNVCIELPHWTSLYISPPLISNPAWWRKMQKHSTQYPIPGDF